jgi:hypothetical protein
MAGRAGHASLRNHVAVEDDRNPVKLAFAGLSTTTVVFRCLKDHTKVSKMLILCLGETKDVVHVHLNKFPSHKGAPTLSRRATTLGLVKHQRLPHKDNMHATHQKGVNAVKPKCTTRSSYWPPGTLNEILNRFSSPVRNCWRWPSLARKRSASLASHKNAGLNEEAAR